MPVAIEKIRWIFEFMKNGKQRLVIIHFWLKKKKYVLYICARIIYFVNIPCSDSSMSVWNKTVCDTIILVISQGYKILLHRRYKSRELSLWTISKRSCKVRDHYITLINILEYCYISLPRDTVISDNISPSTIKFPRKEKKERERGKRIIQKACWPRWFQWFWYIYMYQESD